MDVDWREDHVMLKYHVVTDYLGRFARFGSPFGSVQRPQLAGYHHDESQWEVPMQRWMTLGHDHGDTGIAVVTEAKYGCSVREGDIGLTLLRSPKYPGCASRYGATSDPLCPGCSQVQSDDEVLNTAAKPKACMPRRWWCQCGKPRCSVSLSNLGSVVPAAIKPAEDGQGSFFAYMRLQVR